MKIKVYLALLGFLVICGSSAASSLYKWTDADGVVHFSNVAPPEGSGDVDEYDEAKNQQTVTRPPSNATVTEYGKKKDTGRMSRSDCERTIELTREAAGTHIETAKDNMVKGYITQEQYEKARSAMMTIKNGMSVGECIDATGNDKEIYECLSDSHGCIICCFDN